MDRSTVCTDLCQQINQPSARIIYDAIYIKSIADATEEADSACSPESL